MTDHDPGDEQERSPFERQMKEFLDHLADGGVFISTEDQYYIKADGTVLCPAVQRPPRVVTCLVLETEVGGDVTAEGVEVIPAPARSR